MKILIFVLGITLSLHATDIEMVPLNKNTKTSGTNKKDVTNGIFEGILRNGTDLEELRISHHRIRALPDTVYYLPNLAQLQLSHGVLQSRSALGELLNMAPNLEEFNISHNKLTLLSEHQLPFHTHLKKFDCSGNPIVSIDFTQLRQKLPSLIYFDASCSTLSSVNTEGMLDNDVVPLIKLRGTMLSDAAKTILVKNSQCLHGVYRPGHKFFCNNLMISLALGMGVAMPTVIALGLTGGYWKGSMDIITQAYIMLGTGISIKILGAPVGYFASIVCVPQKQRLIKRYTLDFDAPHHPTESEITSQYQRFVCSLPSVRSENSSCIQWYSQPNPYLDDNDIV